MTPASAATIFALLLVLFVAFKVMTATIKMALRMTILGAIVVLGGVAYYLWA